jgi:hypothetical protein
VSGGGTLDTLKIGTQHHEINVSGKHGVGRIGLFNMNQNRQSPDQFVRDAFGRKRLADFMQNPNQIEQSFFEQSVYRFTLLGGVCKKLCEGQHGLRKPYSA